MSLRKPSFDSSERGSEINISPLIDVMFILLIFFVVTMAFTEKSIISIERPKSERAENFEEKTLNIFVEKSGRINVSGGFVSIEGLEAIAAARPEKTAVIDSDASVEIARIVEIMDACSRAGIERVFIASDRREGAK
ncbi:MAG: biopolymer transporter ExbD [Opitutales bacterium]|nr:biopolymer transporter ExbD [Opitutales bacterium]